MTYGTLHGSVHAVEGDDTIDQVDAALARLYEQFEESPVLSSLATWLGEELQRAEEAVHDLKWFVFPSVASGKTLDNFLGDYGRARQGMTDEQVRALLTVLHAALFQHRTPDVIIRVGLALSVGSTATWAYADDPPAAFTMTVTDPPDAATAAFWNSVLREAKAEGVRMLLHVVPDSSNAFTYDIGPGYDTGIYAHTLETP